MSAYRIKTEDLNTASFDVPVPGFYNPPKHFSAFTMLDNGECVATRGRTTITFEKQITMPTYNEQEGALNAL